MRQIVLDTETTGLEVERGHRIIEIGCVELVNRRPTGRFFHHYLNPEREVDAGARAVHGLSRERLEGEPKFAMIAPELLAFIDGTELIIHNAAFDVAFLDREFALLGGPAPVAVRAICPVLDTLLLARQRHPGQRNNLDALAKRYGIDTSHRELHGALLDARILADVYLAMTGGQSMLALDEAGREREAARAREGASASRPEGPLRVIAPSAEEATAHAQLQAVLDKASGGKCLWRTLEAPSAHDAEQA
jgi:DNA polymerase-3 subunit epsilon